MDTTSQPPMYVCELDDITVPKVHYIDSLGHALVNAILEGRFEIVSSIQRIFFHRILELCIPTSPLPLAGTYRVYVHTFGYDALFRTNERDHLIELVKFSGQ